MDKIVDLTNLDFKCNDSIPDDYKSHVCSKS